MFDEPKCTVQYQKGKSGSVPRNTYTLLPQCPVAMFANMLWGKQVYTMFANIVTTVLQECTVPEEWIDFHLVQE